MADKYEIKFKKFLPVIMVACGTFILGTSFVVGLSMNTITGVILLIMGILMLIKPIAVISKTEICINNIWGITLKRHAYTENEISFKNGSLYLNDRKIVSSLVASMNQEKIMNFIKRK